MSQMGRFRTMLVAKNGARNVGDGGTNVLTELL